MNMPEQDMQPVVSAVVITHNRCDLVVKAIESVQRQTYPNIELIVVDDASTDGTQEKVTAMAKEDNFQYIYIPPEESKGGNHARNVGILASQGAFVAFLDDDDEWLPEKTQKQIDLLRQHPECGVCHCGKINDYNYGERQQAQDVSALLDGNLSREIFYHFVCLSSTMMVDKKILLEVGLFDETLYFWQDYELCMRLFQKTKVAVVREPLVLYRIISSDKNRLTNKIDGWQTAANSIYSKHIKEIELLTHQELKKRDALFYRDGAFRCHNCGDLVRQRQYLKKVFQTTHNPKDLIKAVLNIYNVKEWLKERAASVKTNR